MLLLHESQGGKDEEKHVLAIGLHPPRWMRTRKSPIFSSSNAPLGPPLQLCISLITETFGSSACLGHICALAILMPHTEVI